MNTDLLKTFSDRGIHLYLDDEQLRYRAKPGTLTTEDKARIKANKAAILKALSKNTPEPKRLYQGTQHPGVPIDDMGLPFRPCSKLKGPGPDKQKCGCLHHWKDSDVWRCSECYGMPIRFFGETCLVAREGQGHG